jgi:hypothetical protein
VEFTLYYRGPLKANSGPKEKHRLRQHFHGQLKELWRQVPLSEYRQHLDPNHRERPLGLEHEQTLTVARTVGEFTFAALICDLFAMMAHLSITLLRPEPPGRIVTQSGDIDNRLKTLLDALKVPDHLQALPKGAAPSADERPFFCLLEDDNRISGLNIRTDRLLDPLAHPSEVVILMQVETKRIGTTWYNMGLA